MINVVTYKRKFRFKFKGKKWQNLAKILGYNFQKKRFKYYAIKSKFFYKDMRRKKRWKDEKISFFYSFFLNKVKKRNLKLFRKYFFLKKSNKLSKPERSKIIMFLTEIYAFIEKIDLMNKKEIKFLKRQKLNLLIKDSSKKKKDFRFRKYYYNNRIVHSMWRFKKFLNKRRKQRKFRKIYYKQQIYNLILKQSNNNFFITINDNNNNTVWHRSAGQVFESEKHNIKLKRSYLLVNEMMPFLKIKLKELKIRTFKIYLKSNVTRHIYKVIDYLLKQGINFYFIKFVKPMPHHKGDRKKKLKRR